MNQEQIKGLLSAIVAALGGAGLFGGWMTNELLAQIIGAVAVLAAAAWEFWKRTRANMTATVDSLPNVAGVITKDTPEGRELAASVPSSTVAVAGTTGAATVAESPSPNLTRRPV